MFFMLLNLQSFPDVMLNLLKPFFFLSQRSCISSTPALIAVQHRVNRFWVLSKSSKMRLHSRVNSLLMFNNIKEWWMAPVVLTPLGLLKTRWSIKKKEKKKQPLNQPTRIWKIRKVEICFWRAWIGTQDSRGEKGSNNESALGHIIIFTLHSRLYL